MNNKIKLMMIAVTITALSYGCATVPVAERPLVEKNFELVELKQALAETNMMVEELNNKFMLLQERVSEGERVRLPINSKKLRVFEPADLKVVKLVDDEAEAEVSPPKKIVLGNKDLYSATHDDSAGLYEEEIAEDIYLSGQDYFFSGDYELARSEFERLVSKFPEHPLSDNALYWAGESYYSRQDYESALTFFERVVKDYPRENKAPDAMLKISLCETELGRAEDAEKRLRELILKYPHSPASLKASKRLKSNSQN